MTPRKPRSTEPTPCPKCGQVHLTYFGLPACPGHRHHDGHACGNTRGYKTEHAGAGLCKFHGGGGQNGLKNAQREMAENQYILAENLVANLGSPRPGDPFEIIIEEIARTNGHVYWLAEVVATLGYEDTTWGTTEEVSSTGPTGDHTKAAAGINIWVQLYRAERKHLVYVVKEAAAMGIAARAINLAEQQGLMIADLIRATLLDPELGLTAEQQEAGRHVVSRHLRSVPRGA